MCSIAIIYSCFALQNLNSYLSYLSPGCGLGANAKPSCLCPCQRPWGSCYAEKAQGSVDKED